VQPRDRANLILQYVVTAIEWVVAATLVVLAALATVGILRELLSLGVSPSVVSDFTAVLDGTMLVFVIAELFKIALAYIRHERVIPTVMEAALVAVARKIVVLDAHATASQLVLRAASLGGLLLAIGLSWFLLSRANPAFSKVTSHEE
jgi:uncharacterized membrane protein (DUF373 family)